MERNELSFGESVQGLSDTYLEYVLERLSVIISFLILSMATHNECTFPKVLPSDIAVCVFWISMNLTVKGVRKHPVRFSSHPSVSNFLQYLPFPVACLYFRYWF
jgi:hypothetical protein